MNPELLTRSVAKIYPNTEALAKVLASGKKLRIYFGIDPTGPTLHVGHLSVLLKLRDLQDLGEQIKIVILFGDFTAQIGDPTDKNAVRKMLTPEVITENLKNYRTQIGKIFDLAKTEFRFNNEWLAKLTFAEIVELSSNFTVGQMIERDMFQERIKNDKPVYTHEFLYPLMQGYDSVVLDVDMEVGGNDQTFNMLVGRDLLKKLKNKEKFVLATKLLTDSAGEKMGKTAGNLVAFSDPPADAYGKIMSWPDSLLPLAFELCTRLDDAEIKNILAGHPREAKMKLALAIVAMLHGADQANLAAQEFAAVFQAGAEPLEWQEVTGKLGEKLSDILLENKIIKSKSEFTRLVDEKAIRIWPDELVTEYDKTLRAELKLKIGKKRFVRIVTR